MNIILSLILSTALAAFAALKKSLTSGACVLAWVFAVIIAYCGGITAFTGLLFTFAFTIAAGKISKSKREKIESTIHKKKGPRDIVQIICNVMCGSICILAYGITSREIFAYGFFGAMAASLSDSLASELGILAKKDPVNICTMQKTKPGMSGGVTLWGLLCSLIGAMLIAVPAIFKISGIAPFIIITVSGFIAALIDSILGGSLQAKYECPVCGLISEKPLHCDEKGKLVKGLSFLNNDGVNLLNNISGAVIAMILSAII